MAASPQFPGASRFSFLKGTIELEFSFKVPASGAVSVVRDGKGAQVGSVSAYASGVYTVTLNTEARLPRQVTSFHASCSQPEAGTGYANVALTTESLDAFPASGVLKVLATEYDTAGGALGQPPTGTWVSVMVKGPRRDDLKDAA